MTNEELEAIEKHGRDPLNFCEDARDGLEQLGADVVALVAEVRDANAVRERWKGEVRALRDVGGETDPALDSVIGHWSKLTAEQREGVSKAVALLVDVGLDRAFDVAINAAIDAGLLRRCEDPSHRPNAP